MVFKKKLEGIKANTPPVSVEGTASQTVKNQLSEKSVTPFAKQPYYNMVLHFFK